MFFYSHFKLKKIPREELEKDLLFAGFAIFDCPMKKESLPSIRQLLESSHTVVMITGDNILTACQVAKDLKIISKEPLILHSSAQGGTASPLDIPRFYRYFIDIL
jgi:magnesium-transporting ATPase (P-type)